ncbi:SpoIID/LytB domain-containing protein [Anaerovorax odorimutans]|uniref:SpoIID/LytB domain-containing protein n=1 Tax=Anaerovorax odorimutans TaxID=109327 RepID=UPI00040CF11C|nr:SpoIID/LytB domain-containing protein [Anaerovorax odorimutans]
MKFNRFTIICIMAIMFACSFSIFKGVQAWADSNMEYIKVGLKYGSGAVESCTIESDDSFILGTVSDSGYTESLPLSAYNKIIATVEHGNVVLKDENNTLLSAELGDIGCIMPSNYNDNGVIYFEGTPYRGGIMLLPTSGGKMTVINFLSLEHYLYGVIHSEMGQSNPEEALKAQAVAARSYAVANKSSHESYGFNVCSTTHCQVYKGYSGEYTRTNKAVDDTAGQIIYYNGEPVTSFYHKNSGGHTQNSGDVWSENIGYLKAVDDIYSPDYTWSATFTFDDIQKKLENAGYAPGTVKSVAIKKKTSSGSNLEMEIIGSNKSITLEKDKIRSTLGTNTVKSLMFNLVDSISEDASGESNLYISNGSSKVSAGSKIYIIDGNSTVSNKLVSDIYGKNENTTVKLQGEAENTGEALEIDTNSPLTISGKGCGHGIGMSQDGAIAMAQQGFTYKEILKFYYTGIEIK